MAGLRTDDDPAGRRAHVHVAVRAEVLVEHHLARNDARVPGPHVLRPDAERRGARRRSTLERHRALPTLGDEDTGPVAIVHRALDEIHPWAAYEIRDEPIA